VAVIIGTSGWQYRDWRGRFYPQRLPQRLWLEHYAQFFATVESNAAFYRLPELTTFTAWRERTPADFRWAVKASRYLTHIKRLREPEEPVARMMERAAGLGPKLDVVLLQLPPTLQADVDLLNACLGRFPTSVRVAVEPRHDSWWTDEVRALLERYGAALCWADRMEQPVAPLWRTAEWGRSPGGPSGSPARSATATSSSTSTTTPGALRSSTRSPSPARCGPRAARPPGCRRPRRPPGWRGRRSEPDRTVPTGWHAAGSAPAGGARARRRR
jgi:hypothetical protein